jgi:hypothetical protein
MKNNGRKSANQGENFGRSTRNSDKYSPLEGSTSLKRGEELVCFIYFKIFVLCGGKKNLNSMGN